MNVPKTRGYEIVSHRGAMREAPENTAAAFEAALAWPIDGIELDVQMTADGALVIFHDGDLRRIGGGKRAIADCTLDELSSNDWGGWFDRKFQGEPLLTLGRCVDRFAGRTRLLIEIKSFPSDAGGRALHLTEKVTALLDDRIEPSRRDRIRILSFDPGVLEAAGQSGRWRCVRNLDDPDEIHRIRKAPPYMDAYCASIKKIDPGTVDACRALGRRFMTWSCNTADELDKAVRCGCDVVMTDDPRWIFEHIDSQQDL